MENVNSEVLIEDSLIYRCCHTVYYYSWIFIIIL